MIHPPCSLILWGEMSYIENTDGTVTSTVGSTSRVVIHDAQLLMRAGLRALLEQDPTLTVVGETERLSDLAATADALEPDVVVMDLGDEPTAALTVLHDVALVRRHRVLMMAPFRSQEVLYAAVRAGASGFVLKSDEAHDVVRAARAVALGHAALSQPLLDTLFGDIAATQRGVRPEDRRLESLSRRELDVLRLLGVGMNNAEIGTRLSIGEATVKTHVSNVVRKIGGRDRVHAVVIAHQAGLVDWSNG